MKTRLVVGALITGILVGCSSTRSEPAIKVSATESFELAEQAIERAQRAGAKSWAPEEWQKAVSLLNSAKQLASELQQTQARREAEQALSWADLARVRAQHAKLQDRVQSLSESQSRMLGQ